MAGTLTVSGMSAGLLTGEKIIGPLTITGNAAIGTIIDAALATGDNSFIVPTGAVAVLINLGLPLPTGTTTVILNASGALAAMELSFI